MSHKTDREFYIVLFLVHATNTNKTRLFCPVRVGGVNGTGDKTRPFSAALAAVRDWTKQF